MPQLKTKAKSLGMTMPEFLTHLAANNAKVEGMALESGVGYRAVLAAMKKHGVTRERAGTFEFDGERATLRAHCLRLGLSYRNVCKNKLRNNFSPVDALIHGYFCQQEREQIHAPT